MRTMLCLLFTFLLVFAGWAAPLKVSAANLDATADRVFGQPDFASNTFNNGGISAHSLSFPYGIAIDSAGNLYVADSINNRVLEYDNPLTHDTSADRVFGQPDFTSNAVNNGGVSANSLYGPEGIALDFQGNLYIADTDNSRVLEYDQPLSGDTTADRVFGQPNFSSNTADNGGVHANTLFFPFGVAADGSGNLYIADYGNHRVLEYDFPIQWDATADRVIGQPDLASNTPNNGGLSASSLYFPEAVQVDFVGNLYVSDKNNNRVLEYDKPLLADRIADRVFGQPDFTSNTANNGGITASSLSSPYGLGLDPQGNLYVADLDNNRVLEYDSPLASDSTADRVFGQPSFNSNVPNLGGIDATTLQTPTGLTLDTAGNLYVADSANNRLLEYDLPVPHGAPSINALSPSTVASGSRAFTLTVNGAYFVPGSSVRWNGSDRPTTFLSSTQLNATISPADVAAGGPFAVTVFSPAPGGGSSALINIPLYARVLQDSAADVELGQPDFQDNHQNNLLLPAGGRLYGPSTAAIDPKSDRLVVADTANQRLLAWSNPSALVNGQPAELVIGQPNFITTGSNPGGTSARSLWNPGGMAFDSFGDLYVADSQDNRVLEYEAPLANGMSAHLVFGQGGSFTTNIPDNGGLGANSLDYPIDVTLDAAGNLYVADLNNNRVLEYDSPRTTDTTADRVFGQPSFITDTARLNAQGLNAPFGVAVDGHGNLYVSDNNNNRVLEYDAPLTTGAAAVRVFGQPNFTSGDPNNGGISAHSLYTPAGLALDAAGNLYVADLNNSRVLEYLLPLTTDTSADRVFGQPGFNTSAAPNNGGLGRLSLNGPYDAALDALGNLYVADAFNQRLLQYDLRMVDKLYLPQTSK